VYVRGESAGKAYVKEFIRYYLSEDGRELVVDVGYVAYPGEVYDLALARFENLTTGTIFGGDNPLKGSVLEVLTAGR
ncbi:MAG: protein sphX, partial [Candidatus Marinimicrobia bacterium]|nr:protein sphX [Candidatus Neomarinimicrobiota bacterium]